MPNASTPLSMPLGGRVYSISSLGSLPLRCQVPPIAISQTFLSCLSTRIFLQFQTPCLLLDLCVAERRLCARIPSEVAPSLPLQSHSSGNIPRPTDPQVPCQVVRGRHHLTSRLIPAESHSKISCPSSPAVSIPALRSESITVPITQFRHFHRIDI